MKEVLFTLYRSIVPSTSARWKGELGKNYKKIWLVDLSITPMSERGGERWWWWWWWGETVRYLHTRMWILAMPLLQYEMWKKKSMSNFLTSIFLNNLYWIQLLFFSFLFWASSILEDYHMSARGTMITFFRNALFFKNVCIENCFRR